ncbi:MULTISPECIES: F0F1 ATP synthase subunit B [unclassified Lentimonas]|uniref:F0F1 ATP synthase subunit B n=1 Tax=unclassified Lentimonas TaxID=2630993 RepID=UPI0013295E65|nr:MULTISPECIES: F0F1 ATP synthase subunit B [unclassified Lentimonas]CAA6676413.1 ATP synthase F0 sector subunit b (EC [Lentimonas sp. CC4]CAA6685252.1 ATP synthase F0 sector subunit b (EC [Lentimonas sp. CC6]CAA6690377.1 ATP synthase F0 sector subunit b (EC [Lentimonas sp. CC10]CAA6693076.1 ATP synthase F0 sector subunit b (EC [Lentimonas sp. CC19]CAA7069017.1 ATP synthase F0 sector subunit b (EC [Lentimonas sp. CC11]
MKAIFTTLLLALSLPLGLVAAEDAHAASHDAAVHAVTSLPAHPTAHEIVEHAEDVLEHAEDVAHADESKLTMITEKFGVDWPTLIAQMINFILVAFILYKFAVKPIAATLDERQQKIADGLQYAEEMKTQLAAAERERAEKIKAAAVDAQKILTESREQSKEMIEQKTQEAAAQAEAIIRKASEATELERQKMLSDVRQEVARLVVATSAKVLSRDLSDTEKNTFSESAATELANS